MKTYAFWNNKGGTGKTSLTFQATCRFANRNPDSRILVVDACPQANLSELFLGGLTNNGSQKLLTRQGLIPRCTIGGYFQLRLPSPYSPPTFNSHEFLTNPSDFNAKIPSNITLLCGDPLLELQANAINTLANTQIPGTNTWIAIIDWLRDFVSKIASSYDFVFIDANPSFSIYTQIALSTADLLVLPVMADDSSRRAIQNAFSLLYGLKLPSEIYSQYAFATKLTTTDRLLPKVHLIAKNRLTQYMGPATAYDAVLHEIDENVKLLLKHHPEMFSFDDLKTGLVKIRDFQTTGVVAFAKGCPFYELAPGKLDIGGHRVQVSAENIKNCIEHIDHLVNKL